MRSPGRTCAAAACRAPLPPTLPYTSRQQRSPVGTIGRRWCARRCGSRAGLTGGARVDGRARAASHVRARARAVHWRKCVASAGPLTSVGRCGCSSSLRVQFESLRSCRLPRRPLSTSAGRIRGERRRERGGRSGVLACQCTHSNRRFLLFRRISTHRAEFWETAAPCRTCVEYSRLAAASYRRFERRGETRGGWRACPCTHGPMGRVLEAD